MATFIIAEAGVNHNGEDDKALRLVEVAAQAGADAVKFQTFSAAKLVRPGAAKAEYQERATGSGDQFDMLEALEMSRALHERLVARCRELDIEFMSTAFDEDGLDMLVRLGIRRIKVPSGEITNLGFLRHMARKGLPIILSTGMASLDEVKQATAVINTEWQASSTPRSLSEHLTVLHCTSNYPTQPADVNLNAMLTIAREVGVPIGYSDHTLGTAISTAAVALGARVIEKHFTLDKTLPGPDHAASLDPAELKSLIEAIRQVEVAMGDGVKAPTASELPVRALVRRSVTVVRNIAEGIAISATDIALLRPGNGIAPSDFDKVVGRTAARDLKAGETLDWPDLK